MRLIARPRHAPPPVLGALLAAVALSACVVGPDYNGAPLVARDAVAHAAFRRADGLSTAAAGAPWWTALKDAELDRLVDAALASSPDVEAAKARLRQSRALVQGARANELPTTGTNAAYLRTKGLNAALGAAPAAPGGGNPTSGGDIDFYNVGFDASWELDLFGGGRRALEGARAQAEAAQADIEGVQVSLTAEVAQAYVALRDLQQRLARSRRNAAIEQRIVVLAERRRTGGTASELDVERLKQQLESTQAALVPLQAQIAEQMDRLAVLAGREPGALDAELSSPTAPPNPPTNVAVGDPGELLRRRPDIRAAERRLAQSNAVIGQRTADLFPKVRLFGNIGFGSTDLGSLLSASSLSYLAAPILQWTPFDFGRTRARIRQAEAGRDEAVATYRKAVLSALGDAETALARFGRRRESVVSLARAAASADRVASLTELRVKGGTATVIDQLDAERQRLASQDSLGQAQAQLTQDFIALQKSLGLGWDRKRPT